MACMIASESRVQCWLQQLCRDISKLLKTPSSVPEDSGKRRILLNVKTHIPNPVISMLRGQETGGLLQVWGQPAPYSKTLAVVACMGRPCLKHTANKAKGIFPHCLTHRLHSWRCHVYTGRVSLCSPTWFWTKRYPPASAYSLCYENRQMWPCPAQKV